jgi:hypothetical protein
MGYANRTGNWGKPNNTCSHDSHNMNLDVFFSRHLKNQLEHLSEKKSYRPFQKRCISEEVPLTNVIVESVSARVEACITAELEESDLDCRQSNSDKKRFCFLNSNWNAAWVNNLIPSKRWLSPAILFQLKHGEINVAEVVFAKQAIFIVKILSLGGYYWPFRGACRKEKMISSKQFGLKMADMLNSRAPAWALRLSPILDSDEAMQSLSEELHALGWYKFVRDCGKVFEIELPSTVEELYKTVSPSLLRNIRYMMRRAEKELGLLQWQRFAGDSLTSEIIEKAALIEEKSWVTAKQGDTKLLGSENRRFWQQVIDSPQPGAEVVLWVLTIAGQPAAFSFHVETERTLFIIANGYDESLAQYSFGSILTHQVMSDAISRGRRLLDWGSGDSGYKQKWGAKGSSSLQEHIFFRPTWLGTVAARVLQRTGSSWAFVR